MPRSLRRVLAVLVLLLVLEYVVVPQLAGTRRSLGLLAHIKYRYVVLGLILEAGALLCYAQLTRSVLPRSRGPGLWDVFRIQLATLAVSHVVPGGSAAGSGLGYRLLTHAGVGRTDAGVAIATQGVGSAVVLNVLLWMGLVVSIPLHGYNPLYLAAALAGLVLIGSFSLSVVALVRGTDRLARVLARLARPLPVVDADELYRLVHRVAARLRAIGADRGRLVHALGWAAANWLLDAASLWVFLLAFGSRPGVDVLIVSYGLANVLAAIPLTPGGLGVVETVLVATLVGLGLPHDRALLGVIAWRLVNFWLPIPVGAGAYLSLRFEPSGAGELRRLAERAAEEAEDLRRWSERHAVRLEPGGLTRVRLKRSRPAGAPPTRSS